MGEDKALLELGGQTLLARALASVGVVAKTVRIVGETGKFASFGVVVEDVYHDRGPLGGIHAALAATSQELNLMLAVDLPFVESRFLAHLISVAKKSDATVTVPRIGGGWQPLCAVYRRDFLKIAKASLDQGRNKIDALFAAVRIRVLGEADLKRLGFGPEMFRNVNTPEEWARVRDDFERR